MGIIRPFTFSDLAAILQIENQSFPKSPYDANTFLNLYSRYQETFLVYTNKELSPKEEILGYIIFSRDGHILSIAVHPQHRRKGIASQLIQRAMKIPRLKKLWAEVRKSNRGAQAFYLRMGFKTVGVIPNYYGNDYALIIERIL